MSSAGLPLASGAGIGTAALLENLDDEGVVMGAAVVTIVRGDYRFSIYGSLASTGSEQALSRQCRVVIPPPKVRAHRPIWVEAGLWSPCCACASLINLRDPGLPWVSRIDLHSDRHHKLN